MAGKELEQTRGALAARLGELGRREARIAVHLRGEDGRREADSEDVASLLANDEVLEGLDDAVRAEMADLRDAIARIDSGRYGTCARCGGVIPVERLRSLPHVRCCVSCALADPADRAVGR